MWMKKICSPSKKRFGTLFEVLELFASVYW